MLPILDNSKRKIQNRIFSPRYGQIRTGNTCRATTKFHQIQLTSYSIQEIDDKLEVMSSRNEQTSISSQQTSELAQAGEGIVTETIEIIVRLNEPVTIRDAEAVLSLTELG